MSGNPDPHAVRERLRDAEREIVELRASLQRQLAIAALERQARELAERSRDRALRDCAKARLSTEPF